MLKYYNELVYFVHKMVGDKQYATDIIQEAYTKALETSRTTLIENERAYLYKVAKNIVIDQSRKKKETIPYEEEEYTIPAQDQPEEIFLEKNNQELLLKALNTLPKRSKQAFALHVLEGYTKKEIAKIMGISVNATQKYIVRATQKISEYIEKS
ncbi:MAG: RNA polymerase sigma factor [Arcobacteraceae bacterium]